MLTPNTEKVLQHLREAYPTAAEVEALQQENARLRRLLAEVPDEEIARLYDAYAYAVAGWPEDKVEHFPAVLRHIMDTDG